MAIRVKEPVRAIKERAPARTSGELWTWFFMRISGVVLLILVLGHFTIMHLLGDGLNRVNFAFVAGRWTSPFWQTWDWTVLFLGLLHGANGMRVVIDDYVRRDGRRALLKSLLYLATFMMLLLGTLVILTFDPTKGQSEALRVLGLL